MKTRKTNKKSDPKATAQCRFCEARFRNRQAVRAHLKACPAYAIVKRARQQPEATGLALGSLPETSHDTPRSTSEQVPARRAEGHQRRRDSNDSHLDLLEARETMWKLQQECRSYYGYVRLLACGRSSAQSRCEDWVAIYEELQRCERECEQMILERKLDSLVLYDLYESSYRLSERWLQFRRHDMADHDLDDGALHDTACDGAWAQLELEEALWKSLLTKLKRMYVLCR